MGHRISEESTTTDIINSGIRTKEDKYINIPTSIDEAHFFFFFAMNDYMVPGVEFDENGLCPICQTNDIFQKLKGLNPIVNTFPRSKKSDYDVAVFYTGGKDSSYLLYY